MALVYIRPDADSVDGSWVNASGNNTNLYDSVDESVASDSDYIRSSNNPANDIVKLRLSNFASTPIEPMTVRYRFKKVVSAGETLSMKARLVQGSTTIAEWEHSDVDDTYVDAEQELTSPQFALISDFTDLYLEFEAISGVLEIDSFSASYLLTDESSGFAINATYPGDTADAVYLGEAIAGSVSATSYDDAPLDASNLAQSGTSPKMVHWHESPYVRWTPYNDALQSQTLGTSWTTSNSSISANSTAAPDGTTTADTLIEASDTNQIHQLQATSFNTLSSTNVIPWTASVYVKAASGSRRLVMEINDGGSDHIRAVFDIAGGQVGVAASVSGTDYISAGVAATLTLVGSGWYRAVLPFIPNGAGKLRLALDNQTGTSALDQDYNGDGTSGLYLWGAQLSRGYFAAPYLPTTTVARVGIPQGYDVDADAFGILIEPAGTTVAPKTENFDLAGGGGFVSNGLTTSTNTTAAPDGQLADSLIASGANHSIYSPLATSAATTYTYSIYAKAGTANYVILACQQTTNHWFAAVFDLSDGTVGQTATGATSGTVAATAIVPIGNGWYRCSISGSTTSANFVAQLSMPNAKTGLTFNTDGIQNSGGSAANGLTVHVWGYQVELGTVATSYIPNLANAASVTRAVDNITVLLSTTAHSNTAGTLYAHFKNKMTQFGVNYPTFWTLSDQTNNERINLYRDLNTTGLYSDIQDGGGPQSSLSLGTLTPDVIAQATIGWALNDVDGSFDGGAIVSDPSATMPTVTYMQLGGYYDNSANPVMFLYRLVYVPRQVETDDGNIETWRYAF